MSTPTLIRCYKCFNQFVFLRGSIETCPHCSEEYKSHRDKKDEPLEKGLENLKSILKNTKI